jgi:hypothetical protein
MDILMEAASFFLSLAVVWLVSLAASIFLFILGLWIVVMLIGFASFFD